METTTNKNFDSFNDLVFENRNKMYGAYAIREAYNDNLLKALFTALSAALLIAFISYWVTKTPDAMPNIKGQSDDGVFINTPVDLTPKIEPEIKLEKPEAPKEPVVPKSDNLNFMASDDKKDVVETNNDHAIVTENGKPDGADSVPSTSVDDIGETITTKAVSNEVVMIASEMPEFSGNLFQFIKNNIRYPDIARENLTSGTVVLQFIVEKDGSIGDIKPLKELPDGCTQEAMRVVKSMPRWKPGKNNGEPVRVLFNLPVRFTIK